MVASYSFEGAGLTRRFGDAAALSEQGLRQFRVMATVCALYVVPAILLFGGSYATLFVMNASRFIPFAVTTVLLTICIRRLLSNSEQPFLTWARAYLADFGPQALCLNAAFVVGISAFSSYKHNISHILPFYADVHLAQIDLWLHGQQPWQYLHTMPQWAGGIIDYVYSRIWFLVLIGSFTLATLIYRGNQLKRLIWAIFLNYALLGSIMAISFASVGPIFYDAFYPEAQFTDLTASLQANSEIFYVKQNAAHLLAAKKTGKAGLGTGISAMPSLHVAFAVLTAWLLTGWGRAWATLGWFYAVFIMIGSVYTGWHYAVDGYVSAILASAIWLALSSYYRLPVLHRKVAPAGSVVNLSEMSPG